jgi:hypothetical protein
MSPVTRIIESISSLQQSRSSELLEIFSTIAYQKKRINVNNTSVGRNIIYGIADGRENGRDFSAWRFKTISESIVANYSEVWVNFQKDRYFLERSYFHLYSISEDTFSESEYILLHSDASEPNDTPHCLYKQGPHLHFEVAPPPIPRAHIALYNGRLDQILKNKANFDSALEQTIKMLDSQILKALAPR